MGEGRGGRGSEKEARTAPRSFFISLHRCSPRHFLCVVLSISRSIPFRRSPDKYQWDLPIFDENKQTKIQSSDRYDMSHLQGTTQHYVRPSSVDRLWDGLLAQGLLFFVGHRRSAKGKCWPSRAHNVHQSYVRSSCKAERGTCVHKEAKKSAARTVSASLYLDQSDLKKAPYMRRCNLEAPCTE